MCIDSEAPATEELPNGWDQELMDDFVAEKTDGNDSEGDEQIQHEPNPLITTYHDSLKWAKEVKMFVVEKGLDTVLQDITAVDKLQVAFLSKFTQQTKYTSYFKSM